MVINIKRDLIDNIKVGDVIVTPTNYYMVIALPNKFSLMNLQDGRCVYLRKSLGEVIEIVFGALKIVKVIKNNKLELNEIQE